MNKTININLGGVFFHIDEIAYQKLKNYLNAVRRSLSDDPNGRDEIITDIESRIGELLSDKVKDVRQVINESDIDEVIEIMGKPEDYMVDDEIFSDDSYTSYQRKQKKLYRDGSDKFLGGVSSGIAHYFNVDVIWIRLAWLVAAFGFGFGFLLYIILWILLPQANTTAEKLEMEGEAVNISNIEKKIKEEISGASDKVRNGIAEASEKVKSADYKKYQSKAKSGAQDIVETIGKIFGTLFMVLGKFIGVILIIVSVMSILGLLISLVTLGSIDIFHSDWLYQHSFIYNQSGLPIWMVSILVFLLVAIPFVFLFSLGIMILSRNTKYIGKTATLSLLGVWIVALLITIYFGAQQFMQNAFYNSVTKTEQVASYTPDTLAIEFVDDRTLSVYDQLRYRSDAQEVFTNTNEKLIYSNRVRINILPSNNDEISVKVKKSAKGSSDKLAREKAASIDYNYTLNDKELLFNGYFLTDVANRFSTPRLFVNLYIPTNQIIYLDRSVDSFLDDVDNVQNIYDGDMAKHYYQMTEEGLNCLDCDEEHIRTVGNDPESFNMKIDKKGVHIEIVDEQKDKAEVKITEKGVLIESTSDSIK